MIKKLKDKDGVTLVEVVIAVGLIVILFAMFGTILTTAYRTNKLLSRNKSARETQMSNMESGVGQLNPASGMATGTYTGDLQVELDFSSAKLNFTADPIKNKFTTDKKVKWKAKSYVSNDYGIKNDDASRGRYMYSFVGTESETVSTP